MANSRHPISFFSHYAREVSKVELSRQMYKDVGFDFWSIPGVKGIMIGNGYLGVITAEDHPLQGQLIPTELSSPDYKGLPVQVEYHGYSYHLSKHIDSPSEIRDDAYFLSYQGRRGGGGGTVQGGSQIVCDQEYGTCGGVFVDNANKQYLTESWHVIQKCKGSVSIGSGNKNSPQAAGSVASVGKNGCGCGGSSAGASSSKGWAEIGTYGLGTIANFDYAMAYPALFGRSIDDIPYIGRRPLDHNFFQGGGGRQRQGGGGGRRGGGRGTFYIDGAACPLTGKGNESILGLGTPKGYRRAVMGEKLSYRGVRSGSTKTFPVTGLNYTDRGGICGTCVDMVVCYPCPLPGDSGASFWGTDGFLVAVVTDGSNDKGGNNCTSYNCSIIHNEECFGIHVRGAQPVVGGPAPGPLTPIARVPAPPGKEVTGVQFDPALIEAQQKRLDEQEKAFRKQSYFGRTIAVA